MTRTAIAALLLAGCQPDGACGLGGAGKLDPDRDPIEFLANYNGPSFSELADIEVDGDTVWFCSGVIGLNAYDATNPSRLGRLDSIAVSVGSQVYPRCQHVALAPDGMVYISNRGDSIQRDAFVAAVDGSDPARLVERAAVQLDDEAEGLAVHGPHLLVAAHGAGLLVLDRQTLQILARHSDDLGNAWQVRLDGDVAWVANGVDGLVAVDLSDPLQPQTLGSLPLAGQAKDLELHGGRAWVALGSGGVAVVDVTDPSAPLLLDQADTPGSALGVAVAPGQDAVFVSDWNDLRAFDIADRDRLVAVGHEPVLLQSDVESRSLGIATGRADLLFSSNWTALSSYRYHRGNRSGDLDPAPAMLTLPRTDGGQTATAVVELHNVGSKPLRIEGVNVRGRGLQVELDPGPVAPGDLLRALVSWSPAGSGVLDGWLNVLSDDADEPRKCIPVDGNQTGLTVGDPLPESSFVGLDGSVVRVQDHRGEVVLLAYFATF